MKKSVETQDLNMNKLVDHLLNSSKQKTVRWNSSIRPLQTLRKQSMK